MIERNDSHIFFKAFRSDSPVFSIHQLPYSLFVPASSRDLVASSKSFFAWPSRLLNHSMSSAGLASFHPLHSQRLLHFIIPSDLALLIPSLCLLSFNPNNCLALQNLHSFKRFRHATTRPPLHSCSFCRRSSRMVR